MLGGAEVESAAVARQPQQPGSLAEPVGEGCGACHGADHAFHAGGEVVCHRRVPF
ncbi:hypothetical protein MCC01950_13800 [Bifidobacteriaceae bacterium MCC01950]|nr:hypothetical protein MCC01950_13800 [Bifidobacteriaceae bacterium MCC01950]GDZ06743.1 hypothetical protein MCC01951_04960 [Bifidobacteriaceae bacterium MCC01951]